MFSEKRRQQFGATGSIISLVVSVAMIVAAVLIMLNRHRIYDTYVSSTFQPSNQVAAYVDSTGMSSEGKFYFYASRPSLEDASSFNTHCSNTEVGSAVLGCYASRQIYIYDVNNPQLDGIKDVTAAHEMMHAVYDRLSGQKKSEVNTLVTAEYERRKSDSKLAERVALYDKIEPGQRTEELYAIFATEATTINAALETHYSEYFSDRRKVTTLYDKYSSVFRELEARADVLSNELKSLEQTISDEKSQYESRSGELTTQIQAFNQRASAGDFTSENAFYAERNSLVARSTALEALRLQINQRIDEYTTKVNELNSISTRVTELNSSIDSKLKSGPKL